MAMGRWTEAELHRERSDVRLSSYSSTDSNAPSADVRDRQTPSRQAAQNAQTNLSPAIHVMAARFS